MTTSLVPDLVLDARGVRRDVAVEVQGETIASVRPSGDAPIDAERLAGHALVPGFLNDHSHAFQRDLRGRAEDVTGDFWSWRDAMYGLANRLDPDSLYDVSRRCFAEMVAAGYSRVSEFHYVHHQPDGTPYADPNAMAKAVVHAAEEVGIRVTLLLVAYERAGAGAPPGPEQRRFCDPSAGAYLARLEALAAWAEARPGVAVGAAPHSVRAVSRPWLEAIAGAWTGPVHIHVDEQPREIAACRDEHGRRPIELVDSVGLLGEHTTLVHATHADRHELDLVANSGGTVCVCPTTEANLGDGWVPTQALLDAEVSLTIGSDANVLIDPCAELREIELSARRVSQRRGHLPVSNLLRAGWPSTLGAGEPADLLAVDLAHPTIAGLADQHLAAALVFGGSPAAVACTWVAGREVWRQR
ncbi:MAG: formimidoylglutamate deiminase [Acidimicrobiales bacterium]